MWTVVAALLPAAAVGVFYFGAPALAVLVTATAACVAVDALAGRLPGHGAPPERAAPLTGLLLGMCLPPAAPWWLTVSGATLAVLAPRILSGLLGFNPVNPILLALVVLLGVFPAEMSAWSAPAGFFPGTADAVTAATPLAQARAALQEQGTLAAAARFDLLDGLVGRVPGACGETSALALGLGGLFLVWRGAIGWRIPLSFLGAVAGLAAASSAILPGRFPGAGFHLLTGGLVLGAVFLAGDGPASRLVPRGRVLYGAGCGVLTWLLRSFGAFPGGVAFAILLMQLLAPAIGLYSRADAPES